MRVERGGTDLLKLPVRQFFPQCFPFVCPFLIAVVKDLGHRAPADILDQHGFLVRGGGSRFGLQLAEQLDGSDVLQELLLGAARAQAVVVGDAIVVEILGRVVLVADG